MKAYFSIFPFAVSFSILVTLFLDATGLYSYFFGSNIRVLLFFGLLLLLVSVFRSAKLNPAFLALQCVSGFVGAGIWLDFLWPPFLDASTESFDIASEALASGDLSLIVSNGLVLVISITLVVLLFVMSRVAVHAWAKMALIGNRPLREKIKQRQSESGGSHFDGLSIFSGVFAGGMVANALADDDFLFHDQVSQTVGSSISHGFLDEAGGFDSFTDFAEINPATGLPMIGGIGGVDVGGDVYGSSSGDDFASSSFMDDSFSSGFDDSFSSPFDDGN